MAEWGKTPRSRVIGVEVRVNFEDGTNISFGRAIEPVDQQSTADAQTECVRAVESLKMDVINHIGQTALHYEEEHPKVRVTLDAMNEGSGIGWIDLRIAGRLVRVPARSVEFLSQ